jgi:hypothetical protein
VATREVAVPLEAATAPVTLNHAAATPKAACATGNQVAAAWFSVTGAVAASNGAATSRVATDLLAAGVLPAYVVIAVIAGLVFAVRADHLSHLGDTA